MKEQRGKTTSPGNDANDMDRETGINKEERLIIYQLFPRIFTNMTPDPVADGTLERNGSGHLADIDGKLLRSLRGLGVNCLWLTGVIEHATKTDFTAYGIEKDNPNVVKGEAGSPYAIKDYYDIDPAIASNVEERMKEFEETVDRIHSEHMKVIIDFVPNHTARFYHSDAAPKGVEDFGSRDDKTMFFRKDNNYYYVPNQQFSPDFNLSAEGDHPYIEFPAKATGNDCFTAFCSRNDWYETVKLNYGHDPLNWTDHFDPVPDTWHKMLSILKFWASKGIDGFRCDMVFMVPLPFWHWAIPQVKAEYPGLVFIGEIYDIGLYRPFLDYGCFDYLYDKVNLYDTLVGIERHHFSAARITSCWQTVDGIGPKMLNFLENHDEVRYGSKEFSGDPRRVIPDLTVSALISSGPYMIYYGQELGESAHDNEGFAGDNNRSTIFDYWSYDTMRRWYDSGRCTTENLNAQERWLRELYSKVLNLCNTEESFRSGGFFDLMYVNLNNPDFDPHSLFAFIRHSEGSAFLIVANFADTPKKAKVNIPQAAIEAAGLRSGTYETTDLLHSGLHRVNISDSTPCDIHINGRDSLILRLDTISL